MKTEKVLYAVHRTPQNDNLVQDEISELAGETCTFGASGIIKSLPDYDGNGLIKELLLEDLRGISQAEIYMLEEIGVADPIEYEKIWLDSEGELLPSVHRKNAGALRLAASCKQPESLQDEKSL